MELLNFHFPMSFHLLKEESFFLISPLFYDILSALILSLYCILYILWYAVVTSVVC